MSNVLHHVTAAVWGFALVAGLLTFAAKGWLSRRLDDLEHPARFDRPAVYAGLLAPGLVSTLWLASSLVHLGATGALSDVCCSVFSYAEPTWQHGVFGVGALLVAAFQLRSMLQLRTVATDEHRTTECAAADERVESICESHPELADHAHRIRVVDCEAHVCATVGVWRPRIEIAASLVDRLDDEALASALLHEVAHFRLYDPAAGWLLSVARTVNPFSRVLDREAAAWKFAREVECDRRAVELGARPVSVADALVTAARAVSNAPETCRARLCGHDEDTLSTRVKLLVHDALPERRPASVSFPSVGAAIAAAGALAPHVADAWILSIHCVLEQLLAGLALLG